jgi:DNA sulfur modification protein DndE
MPDIRPSKTSWDLIDTLKRVWDIRPFYVPIRIAIGRSLLSGDKPNFEDYPTDGRSIDTQQIFSGGGTDYATLFRALLVQRYGRALSDDEFLHQLKAHVDHGFELIRNETESFKNNDEYVDYLVELAQSGLAQRDIEAAPKSEATPTFNGLLTLEIGKDAKTDKKVKVEFNRRTNNYLAVTGKPGSGKTQFVQDLLVQLRQQSNYQLNFIFFDYAKGDVAGNAEFVEATRAEVLRLPTDSLPINPFARVDIDSELAVKMAAQEFADTIRDVERGMGTVQGQKLYDAILQSFQVVRGSETPFPDFYDVREELETAYRSSNSKQDTLTEVLRQLTDFQIFATADSPDLWQNVSDKTVIIDLHELTVLREMTVCLFLNALYRELMTMPDSDVNNGTRAMRTIVVIDEAHHFLKDKKRNRILERLIREIRSKGASVFLMSQSPDDYDQKEFDFTELLEFIFVLQSNVSANGFLQSALGVSAIQAKQIASEIPRLASGAAFSKSFEGKETANQLNLRQFWRDKGK